MQFFKRYLFFILFFTTSLSFAQRGKNGSVTVNTANRIVNEYTTLTADATAGATSISVAASGLNANGRFAANLAPGDLIMIIQMQGVTLNGTPINVGGGNFLGFPDDNTWGQITAYNNCGNHEFCEVSSIPNGTTINIVCGLQNSYTSAGRVQIVRVPRYNSLTINSPGSITCTAWGATFIGGIVAIEVLGNTVIGAGASINATALGFRGGALGANNNAGFGGGQNSATSPSEGADKGEGIGGYQTDYSAYGGRYAKGPGANAGGGGDSHNSGGGGGGNAGNIAGWDGLGNPDNTNATWATAWNLESAGFAAHVSSGGGKGGYSFASANRNALVEGPWSGVANNWGGDLRRNNGGMGGRPLDYSTGRLFLGGGGGAADMDDNAGGAGGKGGGLIYLMSYGAISGAGSIISNGGNGGNSGIDGAGGAGAGGTIVLNSVGAISGITANANGGTGGNQAVGAFVSESEGPGGGGGGGYIAVSNGAIAQTANAGSNGTTNSQSLSEFPPNGATKGAAGITNQAISADTIVAPDVSICTGNTATLTASIFGGNPATINWYSVQTGGVPIATGTSFTTPVLFATTTYYVSLCPGTYRKPVKVIVTGVVIATSPITGPTTVCPNQIGVTYSVINTLGSTYNWTVPAGASITAGQTTNSIAVTFGATGGTVSVTETNSCGTGTPVTLAVAIGGGLPVTSAITGLSPICPNVTGVVYSVTNTAGSTYNWTVPVGATLASGQTTNTITVDFGATAGTITCTETNACGSGAAVSINVATVPTPTTSAISGVTSVCENDAGIVYSVVNTVGSTYNWSVPLGETITSGQGTNSITISFTSTGGTVSVAETNACGTGVAVNTSVTNNPLPVTLPISGPTDICNNATGMVYYVFNDPGSTYNWIVPAGMSITSGQTTDSITVNFGTTGGTISVTETNACGSGSPVTTNITAYPFPVTSAITGSTPVCQNSTGQVYSVINSATSTYIWSVPAGASITSGQGTNSITVSFGTTGGTVTCAETNGCASAIPVNLSVSVTPLPSTSAITGTTPICPGVTGVSYSVINTAGSTYNWTVPAGAIITAGQNTNAITVDFGATAGNISVAETNSCGNDAVNFAVAIGAAPVPSAITGPATVCANATGINYSVTNAVGLTYLWAVPVGANITAGQGTNAITVSMDASGGNVSVSETNSCGTGNASLAVAATTTPVTPPIVGTSPVCAGATSIIYSVTNIIGSIYTWTVPTGVIITAGQGSNSITVNWGNGSASGNITCTENNNCGTGTLSTMNVLVNNPPIISAIFGSITLCPTSIPQTYFVTNVAGSTYTWTVPAGASIVSGQGTSSVSVLLGVAGGTISVNGANGACTGNVALPINILPTTIANAGPDDTICLGDFARLTASGGTTYNWLPPAGLSSTAVASPIAQPTLTTTYTVTASVGGFCPSVDSVTVIVNPIPTVNAGQDVTINIGEDTVLSGTGQGSLFWTVPGITLGCTQCPNPIVDPRETTSYYLTVTSIAGCTNVDTVVVFVNTDFGLYIPNAFSPDGGANSVFMAKGYGLAEIDMAIYNRWGEKIFFTGDQNKGWDGTYGGAIAEQDVYVYVITATPMHGASFKRVGHVTLVR